MIVCEKVEVAWPPPEVSSLAEVVRRELHGGKSQCSFCSRPLVSGGLGPKSDPRAADESGRPVNCQELLVRARHTLLLGTHQDPEQPCYWVYSCAPCRNERLEHGLGSLVLTLEYLHERGDYRGPIVDQLVSLLRRLLVPEPCIQGVWQPIPSFKASKSGTPDTGPALRRMAARATETPITNCMTCGLSADDLYDRGGRGVRQPLSDGGLMTRGHLIPRKFSSFIRRYWVPQCTVCNSQQGERTLYDWFLLLESSRDYRTYRVRRLLLELLQLGVVPREVAGASASVGYGGGRAWMENRLLQNPVERSCLFYRGMRPTQDLE